ncbi:hypothetical protein [Kitasatospora sp. NPDC058478]|uniref:hypothetical protein n=1 Tax=unclassified Kitasatospora TaxID=2633591 RepID=UPI00365B8296
MRVNVKLTVVGVAAAGSIVLLAPAAGAAPRSLAPGEAVVSCVDRGAGGRMTGDNLAVLTPLDEEETEAIPDGTTLLHCTNSALSTEPVTLSLSSRNTGGARSVRTTQATLRPGESADLEPSSSAANFLELLGVTVP